MPNNLLRNHFASNMCVTFVWQWAAQVRRSNILSMNVLWLCRYAMFRDSFIVIEQPSTSQMFGPDPWSFFIRLANLMKISTWMGAFGGGSPKPSMLITDLRKYGPAHLQRPRPKPKAKAKGSLSRPGSLLGTSNQRVGDRSLEYARLSALYHRLWRPSANGLGAHSRLHTGIGTRVCRSFPTPTSHQDRFRKLVPQPSLPLAQHDLGPHSRSRFRRFGGWWLNR